MSDKLTNTEQEIVLMTQRLKELDLRSVIITISREGEVGIATTLGIPQEEIPRAIRALANDIERARLQRIDVQRTN